MRVILLLYYWVDTVDNMEGNSDVSSPPTYETQMIGGVGLAAAAINRIHHLSSHSLQLTAEQYGVFGESVGSGSVDLQLVKKVVATVGQYEDYYAEINQSYVLGFPPYRLHAIRYYDGKVYVLDDVAMLQVDIL